MTQFTVETLFSEIFALQCMECLFGRRDQEVNGTRSAMMINNYVIALSI